MFQCFAVIDAVINQCILRDVWRFVQSEWTWEGALAVWLPLVEVSQRLTAAATIPGRRRRRSGVRKKTERGARYGDELYRHQMWHRTTGVAEREWLSPCANLCHRSGHAPFGLTAVSHATWLCGCSTKLGVASPCLVPALPQQHWVMIEECLLSVDECAFAGQTLIVLAKLLVVHLERFWSQAVQGMDQCSLPLLSS